MQIEQRAVGSVMILDLKGKITLGEGDEALKDKINFKMPSLDSVNWPAAGATVAIYRCPSYSGPSLSDDPHYESEGNAAAHPLRDGRGLSAWISSSDTGTGPGRRSSPQFGAGQDSDTRASGPQYR